MAFQVLYIVLEDHSIEIGFGILCMLNGMGYYDQRHSKLPSICAASWSQAGGSAEYRPAGFWWGATPKTYWPEDEEMKKSIMKQWVEPHGDRRQELVYIGQNLPKDEMITALNDCVLTDDEMNIPVESWADFMTIPFMDTKC